MMFLKGIGVLVLILAAFSLFTLKAPKGGKAMGGLANAAVASFFVEALLKYILGDFVGIPFFATVGENAGSLGGCAAVALVGLAMGTDPVAAIAGAVALKGFGILPGFLAGYLMHFVLSFIKKHLPDGVDTIVNALVSAAGCYGTALLVNPGVTAIIGTISEAVLVATEQSPLVMGFLLGGIMKTVCTSPLSSMALSAMLQLTGLPMGIACIACFGGTFTNGVLFHKLRLGDRSRTVAVMLEPLTQADIITKNPFPIYASDFFGGGCSGIIAAALQIICNAPGTAAPVPGMLAPFAFNAPLTVLLGLALSALAGTFWGYIGSVVFASLKKHGKSFYTSVEEAL